MMPTNPGESSGMVLNDETYPCFADKSLFFDVNMTDMSGRIKM